LVLPIGLDNGIWLEDSIRDSQSEYEPRDRHGDDDENFEEGDDVPLPTGRLNCTGTFTSPDATLTTPS
jgi:hypothetical protein